MRRKIVIPRTLMPYDRPVPSEFPLSQVVFVHVLRRDLSIWACRSRVLIDCTRLVPLSLFLFLCHHYCLWGSHLGLEQWFSYFSLMGVSSYSTLGSFPSLSPHVLSSIAQQVQHVTGFFFIATR